MKMMMIAAVLALSLPVFGSSNGKNAPFKIGIAGYSFVHAGGLDNSLDMMKKMDVSYLCVKDFHLPFSASDEKIAEFKKTLADAKVVGYAIGPIYMSTEAKVDEAFAFAKRLGVDLIVGIPRKEKSVEACPELLKYVEKKVKETNIRYAIHNHGPDQPKNFPDADFTMELIKDLDERVGMCLDIGHELRNGKNPVTSIRKYSKRIHDVHIKNVTADNKGGRGIEMPRGKVDIVGVVKALRETGYTGVCSLEYEKDMRTPLLGMTESIGYFKGVVDATE